MREFGQKGGKQTKAKNGLNFYSEIGKKGANVRWKKQLSTKLNGKPLTEDEPLGII